uniref:AGC-kinase C-terminal domain-containing protein n=1 Tax=Rodentolepis nana TaxID=102285 RepID=A0A0R3TEV9_RODNA
LSLITGYGPDGFQKIESHEFFKKINWTDLVNLKVTPPFKPVCMLDNLAFNFDKEYTSKTPKDSPAAPPSASAHELFRGFSYVAPFLVDRPDGTNLPQDDQSEYPIGLNMCRITVSALRFIEMNARDKRGQNVFSLRHLNPSPHNPRSVFIHSEKNSDLTMT